MVFGITWLPEFAPWKTGFLVVLAILINREYTLMVGGHFLYFIFFQSIIFFCFGRVFSKFKIVSITHS